LNRLPRLNNSDISSFANSRKYTVTLFDQSTYRPAPRRRRFAGGLFLLVFAASLIFLVFAPTPYVIERPGPVFDVLSVADGEPVIEVDGAPSFATKGQLDLLTVSIVGSRENTPSWLELAMAWSDPAQKITPIEAIFPVGETNEQSKIESSAQMEQSQQEAIAVALRKLGYEVGSEVYVSQVAADAPASGKIRATDFLKSVDGVKITDVDQLRDLVGKWNKKEPLTVSVERAGKLEDFEISPVLNSAGDYRMGVLVGMKYDFPVQVQVKLSDVGGPSGGMIFALAIYDLMTPGYLLGGEHIAGTGTLDPSGAVGPIGGIAQKIWAAKSAGAKYFFAPADNCADLEGHTPDGIQVLKITNFDDALLAADTIGKGESIGSLPSCSAN